MVVVFAGLFLAGCAGVQQKAHTHNSESAFTESQGTAIPAGFGELALQGSIKTHPAGFYPLESGDSHHGSDHYPFVVSIGAQSTTWNVKGVKADTPKYAPDGSDPKDPEAGPGMRYSLDKRLLLKPGVYDVRIELPDDGVEASAKVTVVEGKAVSVNVKPIYRMKDLPVRSPCYRKGVSSIEVLVNGAKQ